MLPRTQSSRSSQDSNTNSTQRVSCHILKIIIIHRVSKWLNSLSSHSGSHHNTRHPLRVLQSCDWTVHSSQLNAHNISIHMISQFNRYSTCHLHIFYHTFIIPRQYVITPHALYTCCTIIILIYYVSMIISLKQFYIIIGKKHENTKNTQFYQSIDIRASVGPSNTTMS